MSYFCVSHLQANCRENKLRAYNAGNPYETISITERAEMAQIQPSPRLMTAATRAETEAKVAEALPEKLETFTDDISKCAQNLRAATLGYRGHFERLAEAMFNPATAGLNIE